MINGLYINSTSLILASQEKSEFTHSQTHPYTGGGDYHARHHLLLRSDNHWYTLTHWWKKSTQQGPGLEPSTLWLVDNCLLSCSHPLWLEWILIILKSPWSDYQSSIIRPNLSNLILTVTKEAAAGSWYCTSKVSTGNWILGRLFILLFRWTNNSIT